MRRLFIIPLILMVMLGCEQNSATSSEKELGLKLEVQQISVITGDNIYLEILLEQCPEPLFGLCFQLDYTEELLSNDTFTVEINGNIFSENCMIFTQEESGIIHTSISLQQGDEPVNSTGLLCEIEFVSQSAGTAQFDIIPDSIIAYNESGNVIDCEILETETAECTIN